jgi:serine/threonine protein kinase/formylglycine-generating enzyme required for sulfatase activity
MHPTDQTLKAYSLGRLGDELADSVQRHLEECPDCQRRVAEMSSDSFLRRLRDAGAQEDIAYPVQSATSPAVPTGGDSPRPAVRAGTIPPDLMDHPDYQIIRELGRGGMGVVYLAHNRLMGRDEVLKVVGRHLLERKGVLDRFSREIRSAARLTHPNIVHAYSAFRSGESIVFAMEYVEGLDLAKLVKANGPLSIPHASNFAYQAALGLQHAHQQGMVHRDIKPSNLMLARKGGKAIVKVLDFGLAKATRESPTDVGLTLEGQMLGTPDFIAPEQIRDAQSAGIQADIYSLGCTLYYLLTGQPPFEGPSLYDLLQAHFSMVAQPLNLVRPEVPAELAALAGKMMAKDPGRRFQTPAEVAEALKPFFKKADATSRVQVSIAGQPGTRSAEIPTVPPTADPTRPSRPPGKPADSDMISSKSPGRPTGVIAEPVHAGEVSAAGPAPSRESVRRPPWKPWPMGIAAGAFGLVLLGIMIVIITWNGRKTVDTEKAGGTVVVDTTADHHGGIPAVEGAADQSRAGSPTAPGVPRPSDPQAVESASGSGNTPQAVGGSTAAGTKENSSGISQGPVIAGQSAPGVATPPVYANSIGMKLALLPGGEFMMGSPEGDDLANPNEKPQHTVRISSFYIGVYEVTQSQYQAVMGNNPSLFGGREDPVQNVSWVDAALFCNSLSEKEGRTPFYPESAQTKSATKTSKGPGYRLPREAEWEYACRAGTKTRYCFGDDPWILTRYTVSGRGRHGGDTTQPNPFGLYDMHGSVAEWCLDWFDHGYYRVTPSIDPPGASISLTRAQRGGSVA